MPVKKQLFGIKVDAKDIGTDGVITKTVNKEDVNVAIVQVNRRYFNANVKKEKIDKKIVDLNSKKAGLELQIVTAELAITEAEQESWDLQEEIDGIMDDINNLEGLRDSLLE